MHCHGHMSPFTTETIDNKSCISIVAVIQVQYINVTSGGFGVDAGVNDIRSVDMRVSSTPVSMGTGDALVHHDNGYKCYTRSTEGTTTRHDVTHHGRGRRFQYVK